MPAAPASEFDLAAAGARSTAADATRFPGIAADSRPVDMPGLVAGKRSLVEAVRSEKYFDLIDDYGWDLRRGTDGTTGDVVVTATTRADREEHTASRLLVATGRRPVTEGLRLESVGVGTGERGEVVVDGTLATSNPRIWAAGDVTGHPEFVYVASAHGALAVENAFSDAGQRVDYTHLPRVTFTTPSVGAVGMTDKQATAAGILCECRVLPLEHVSRALVNRDIRGFVKIVAEVGTGRILGITAVAENAGDLAAAGVYVMAAGMTVEQEVATTWSPYLTMSEGIRIAAQSFSTDVSRLSCCAA